MVLGTTQNMGRSGYTSLSIEQTQYARTRRKWETIIAPNSDLTYTQWHSEVLENSLDRIVLLKKMFPNFSLLKLIDRGIIIDDKKTDDVIKVYLKNGKFVCSDKKNPEDYILYTALHPEFIG